MRKINGKNISNFYVGAAQQVTGTTVKTKLLSIEIPANTFKAEDFIVLETMFSKNGTSNVYLVNFYWNTTNSLTGAIQLAVRSVGATQLFDLITRRLSVRTANGGGSGISLGTEVLNVGDNPFNEFRSTTASNVAIDWTSTSYLMCSAQLFNATDSITNHHFKVWNY